MQTRRITQISVTSAIVAAILGFSASPAMAVTSTCVDNGTVEVCAEWSQGLEPQEGVDFKVEFHAGAGADVALLVGDLDWRLWTTLVSGGAATDFGNITLDPTISSDDFEVEIDNGANPGAVNVGNINLDDVGFSGFSSIENFEISGDLGGLTVVQDSGGAGGTVEMTIDGNVSGAVTFPVSFGFVVKGDLTAALTITDNVADSVRINGDVTSTVTLEFADSTNGDAQFDQFSAGNEFSGDLILTNGVPADALVKIFSAILSTTEIDLTNDAVAGDLLLNNDNAGTIVNGSSGDIILDSTAKADGSRKW